MRGHLHAESVAAAAGVDVEEVAARGDADRVELRRLVAPETRQLAHRHLAQHRARLAEAQPHQAVGLRALGGDPREEAIGADADGGVAAGLLANGRAQPRERRLGLRHVRQVRVAFVDRDAHHVRRHGEHGAVHLVRGDRVALKLIGHDDEAAAQLACARDPHPIA